MIGFLRRLFPSSPARITWRQPKEGRPFLVVTICQFGIRGSIRLKTEADALEFRRLLDHAIEVGQILDAEKGKHS